MTKVDHFFSVKNGRQVLEHARIEIDRRVYEKGHELSKAGMLAAAQAILGTTPVWSGQTQKSLRVSRTGATTRYTRNAKGTPGTNRMPVGRDAEPLSNMAAVISKLSRQYNRVIKKGKNYGDWVLTVNSPAVKRGLYEGNAPRRSNSRIGNVRLGVRATNAAIKAMSKIDKKV